MNHYFSKTELLVFFEAARVALSDADTFDFIAEKLDIDDFELKKLQEKLNNYMVQDNVVQDNE